MAPTEKALTIRLLVVDDDETLLEMMTQRFDRKGIKIITAANGADALTLVSQGRFDIARIRRPQAPATRASSARSNAATCSI